MTPARAALLTLAAARLTRLVVWDEIADWWLKDPIDRAAEQWYEHESARLGHEPEQPWWWKYRSGLDCPHCFSFWAALAVFGIDALAGDSKMWRLLTSALATSYVVGHVSARLDDGGEDDA